MKKYTSYLHYEIVEKLGEGGMGRVYLAQDTKLKRSVALKFLPRHISQDPTERKRFEQEAQAAALLNHSNIAQVYAIEEFDDEVFIVIEYVEGKELKELIEEGIASEQKVSIATQIAQGLKVAHDSGVIHRDIKSRNIMVDRGRKVKIMDFGLARVQGTEHITKTGTTLGTTAYMAPEQLAGQEIGKQADIWSYGVVLYEFFSGQLPFQGLYEPAVMYAIVEEEPLPITEINPNIPEWIRGVIEKCLKKDPEQRYQDFSEILEDLSDRQLLDTDTSEREKAVHGSRLFTLTHLYVALPAVIILAIGYFLLNNTKNWFDDKVPDKKFLAVLPVENIGNNPDLQAICDGLGEIFSYRLSELEKYEDLYWVAPAGEMRREKILTASQANRLFGVNLAILSSIQSVNDSTRLILELVDADNIRRLETAQVTIASQNLASLEFYGIKAMLKMLQIKVDSQIEKTLEQGIPTEKEAYEYYLKALANLQAYSSPDSLENAILYFEKSIELEPGSALSHAGLGESYWRKYEKTKDIELVKKAESALSRALDLNKELAPVQTLLGLLKSGTGQQKQALVHFKKAIEIDPKYSPAYRGLAKVHNYQDQKEKAVSTYQLAINLKPHYWEGYKDLGIHYFTNGNLELAIEQFQKVVEVTPRSSNAYSNLGAVYYYKGAVKEARQMFEKSLALGKNPSAANNLASIYYQEGRYADAVNMYRIALEASPDGYVYWANLGSAYTLNGELYEARKAYLQAIERAHKVLEINPNDAEVMADLGAYYSDVDNSVSALQYLHKSLELDPDNILVQQRAVFTYENLGMRQEALSWINSSIIADLETQPELQKLTKDPRFKELKAKMNNSTRKQQ